MIGHVGVKWYSVFGVMFYFSLAKMFCASIFDPYFYHKDVWNATTDYYTYFLPQSLKGLCWYFLPMVSGWVGGWIAGKILFRLYLRHPEVENVDTR